MIRRSLRFMLWCWFVGLVSAPGAIQAATVRVIDDGSADMLPQPASAAACILRSGSMRPVSFIWTPPEELTAVAWKIPVASCFACGAGGVAPTNVSFAIRWLGPCTAQAQVLIVGARSEGGCLAPDTSQVLCEPTTYTISGTANALELHSLPIPSGCCIAGDAFLLVRFSGLAQCANASFSPGLAASTAPCVNCEQFVTAAGIFTTMTEWCSIGAANTMWLSLTADCCLATPARKHSWGRLKMIYR